MKTYVIKTTDPHRLLYDNRYYITAAVSQESAQAWRRDLGLQHTKPSLPLLLCLLGRSSFRVINASSMSTNLKRSDGTHAGKLRRPIILARTSCKTGRTKKKKRRTILKLPKSLESKWKAGRYKPYMCMNSSLEARRENHDASEKLNMTAGGESNEEGRCRPHWQKERVRENERKKKCR